MNTRFKRLHLLSFLVIGALIFSCISCQKAAPSPYSNPNSDTPVTITPPAFSADMNNSVYPTSFTPIKSISGAYVTLKGVSTYYTVSITFPVSTGTGYYTIGGHFGAGFSAKVVNGPTTYVVNTNWGGGNLQINSISSDGKYTGTFSMSAQDSVTRNYMNADQGSFSNM